MSRFSEGGSADQEIAGFAVMQALKIENAGGRRSGVLLLQDRLAMGKKTFLDRVKQHLPEGDSGSDFGDAGSWCGGRGEIRDAVPVQGRGVEGFADHRL